VWDCSAQERYRAVTRAFCKGADAVVVVYDITNLASFGQVQPWVERIRESIGRDPDAEPPSVILGTCSSPGLPSTECERECALN
jgi:GTPase SAR1 family protein